ncbi:hypothetical protein [Acetobacter fallax]|uniref:Uncharacterized protein n=1 Tax=Acetobacter fallax TaxID=1737473 RepID=A0ABX0K9X2_9PROT|nr:hypothetical protein [Acetobacter fallax]NHO33217.1 hypothetical protein [Acetobacter fallax]NHO36791.1 hypothetical protein [Acetobacter fallax]
MDGFLLDYWGNILDFNDDQGFAVNRQMDGTPPRLRVAVEDDIAMLSFQGADGKWETLSVSTDGYLRPGQTVASRFAIEYQRRGMKYIAIGFNGLFLSADPGGGVKIDKHHVYDWETFRVLSVEEFGKLAFITGHSWYSRSLNRVVSGPVPIAQDFEIDFSGIRPKIDDLFKSVSDLNTKSIDVFYNSWRFEHLELFNPLVYCCTFGRDEAFETLDMVVDSLRRFAKYDGDIKILTERSPEDIRNRYEAVRDDRVELVPYVPLDLIDYMSSRFDIGDYEQFHQYQPILYLDTDIIAGRSVDKLFLDIMRDSEPSVYVFVETRDPASENYWGKELFDADEFARMPEYGFSTGVMAFRNLEQAGPFLKNVRRVIFRQSRGLNSRMELRCYDQPVANYVLSKMGCRTDAKLLNRYVRNFDMGMNHAESDVYDRYASALTEPVLHFAGGVGGYDWKLGAMHHYRAWLIRSGTPDFGTPDSDASASDRSASATERADTDAG